MPRSAGSNVPNIENIEIPNLTDNTQANFQSVMNNSLQNFSNASQALASQAQANNAEYQRRAREEAEEGQNGGVLGNIAEFGKSITAGYLMLEEMKARKNAAKAQAQKEAAEMELKYRDQALKEREYLGKEEQKVQDVYIRALEGEIQGLETEVSKKIAETSATEGLNFWDTAVSSVTSSEYFKLLSPASKVDVIAKLQESKNKLFKDQLDEITSERKKLESEQINTQYNAWYQTNLGRLEKIRSGAGAYSDEEINKDIQGLEASLQEYLTSDSNKALFSNPTYALQFYNRALQEIGTSLKQYYGDTYSRNSEASRFVQAADNLAALDIARQIPQEDGGISEGQYQVEAQKVLTQLGLDGSPDKFPTSQRASLERELNDLKSIKEYRELVAQDRNVQSIIGDETPQGQLYNRSIVGTYLFNGINSKGIASLKQDLKYLIQNSPGEAQRMNAGAILELADQFEPDVNQWNNLNKEFKELEQKAAALGYNPPAREYILKPGDPNITVDEKGNLQMQYQTQPEITLLERPGGGVPSHSPDEIEAVQDRMEIVEHQRRVLMWKWGQYGIDISNPSDPTLNEKLRSEAKEVEAYVKGKSAESNIDGSVNPDSLAPTGTDKEEVKQVRNAVVYELKQNKILDQYRPVGAYDNDKQRDLAKSSYYLIGADVVSLVLAGNEAEAKKRIDNFQDTANADITKFGVNPINAEQAARSQKALRELMDWSIRKRNWYRNRYSQQSRSNEPPTNFTTGSRDVGRAPATPPKNESPMRPSIPLNGSLAVWEGGYAPFKTGTVTLTSDYGVDRGNHRHQGVDLSSTDPRVASIQGGKVKWAGNWEGSGYGNVVFVETGDGHIEMFAHLNKVNVKTGQIINPADVVGIMGNTGNSDGVHLHFEVWGNGNWSHPREGISSPARINPHDYFRAFQGKTEMPTVTGGNANPGVRYHTGAFRLSNGLLYVNGYIIDGRTGVSRKARPEEYEAAKTATPVYKVVHNALDKEVATHAQSNGQVESYHYSPPKEAYADKIFMFLKPAGYKDKNGADVYQLEAYEKQTSTNGNHVRLFAKPVTLGGSVTATPQSIGQVQWDKYKDQDVMFRSNDFRNARNFVFPVEGGTINKDPRGEQGHRGVDIFAPQNSRAVSPWSGTIIYAQEGGTRNTEDSDPTTPGYQPQHSIKIKLDQPQVLNGKKITHIYLTHLSTLAELKPGQRVNAGDFLGTIGTAGGSPHLHMGMGASENFADPNPYGYTSSVEMLSSTRQQQQQAQPNVTTDGNYTVSVTQNGLRTSNGGEVQVINQGDSSVINGLVNKNRNVKLYVRSQPIGVVRSAPPRSAGNRPVNLQGKLSIHRKDYASLGSPEDDYGYAVLKKHPRIRQALYNAAVALDVPMVWIADQLIRESGFDPTVPSPLKRHKGIFQIDVPMWSRVLGFDSSIFQPGESNIIKQIDLYVKYIKHYEQHEIHKKVETYEELLLCVWASGALVKRYISNPSAFRTTDGWVYWNSGRGREDYRKSVGQQGGRRYQWTGNLQSRASHIHDAPRGQCSVCNSMLRNGSFNAHFA